MGSLPTSTGDGALFRFGVFEFRSEPLGLYKFGIRLKLQEQPARVLLLLLETPGQLVSRERLRKELWPDNTFVEFDAGLNTTISKLRAALGDSTANPIFIERVPKLGYRFVAPVQMPAQLAEPAANLVAAPPSGPALPSRKPWPVSWAVALGAGLLVVVLAGAGWRLATVRSPAEPAGAVRFTLNLPPEQTLASGQGRSLALAPNGRALAYIALRGRTVQIFGKRWEESSFRALPGTEGAADLFFSPDGRSLVFTTAGKMMRIPFDGRDATELAPVSEALGHRSGVWGSDGAIYFGNADSSPAGPGAFASAIYRLKPGAPPTRLVGTAPPRLASFFAQQLLPGGRDLLISETAGPRERMVGALSVQGGSPKRLVEPAMGGYYLPTGHLVYSWNDNLIAAPFSLAEMRMLGPGVVVVPGVAPRPWAGTQAAISDNGTLAYVPAAAGNRTLLWVDRAGHETPLDLPPARYDVLSISPSGSRILLARTEAAEKAVWIYQMSPPQWTRLAAGDWANSSGVWSPDERSVVFTANLQGESFENLYLKRLQGNQPPERLAPSPNGQFAQSWSPVRGLVYTESERPGTHIDSFLLPVDGNRRPAPLVTTTGNDLHGAISPDGRWVAYTSDISGRHEVYLQHAQEAPIPVSNAGGSAPLWSPAGTEIFYRTAEGVWSAPFRNGRPGTPSKLFSGQFVSPGAWNRQYALTPDGSRFLMLRSVVDPEEYRRIHVVLNWSTELSRLVPAGR